MLVTLFDFQNTGVLKECKEFFSMLDKNNDKLRKAQIEEVHLVQSIDSNYLSHYWYSGEVIRLKKKNKLYILEAIGDINAKLFLRCNNECLEHIKDKNNKNSFYVLSNYLKKDTELYDSKDGVSDKYRLEIESNNWWQVTVKEDGNIIEYVLDCELLPDAFEETLNNYVY